VIFVALKVNQVRVDQRACYASVAKPFLNVKDVFCTVVFYGCALMHQSVEGYLVDPFIQ